MAKRSRVLTPIVRTMDLNATPSQAYRSLTSQTELRKWLAPKVISAKNIVSVEDDRDVEMRMLQKEQNRLVRFNWRPFDWEPEIAETILTFEIKDLGVSRSKTGAGIRMIVTHDGWVNRVERDRQKSMLLPALDSLKALLEGSQYKCWWLRGKGGTDFRHVTMAVIKQFVENIEKESGNRRIRKLSANNILKLYQNLENTGEWYLKENDDEVEFRVGDYMALAVLNNGTVCIDWKSMEAKLEKKDFRDFVNRLAMEQGIEPKTSKSRDIMAGSDIHPDLLAEWIKDCVHSVKSRAADS